MKYPGILVDQEQTFKLDCLQVIKTITRNVNILLRIHHTFQTAKTAVYNAPKLPHSTFCTSITNTINGNKLDRLQNCRTEP